MGIIRQQTIKGSVFSYLGAVLGLVNTGILFPRILEPDKIGLLSWLVAVSAIAAQFSTLGFNNVTSRLFPYFRNEKRKHHGFLIILFCVGMVGFIFALIAFFVAKPFAIEMYRQESPLYTRFIYYLLPLVFFSLYFNLLDGYNRVMYDVVSGTFFRDIVFKLLTLGGIVLYWQGVIDFSAFLLLYVIAYCLPAVLLFLLLWSRGQISFGFEGGFIGSDLRRSMFSVSFFGILNGLSDKLTNNIDRIMIVAMAGLGANGIYATMANFGVLVSMPSRSLKKIASTVIAEAWKRDDRDVIGKVYSQSGLHQFIAACLLFIGIWVNIDNIFQIVTPRFLAGKYVVLFIGLTHVLNMLSGVSGVVIQNSPHYRVQTYLMITFGCMVLGTNALMIPLWGITGAAVATLVSSFIFNFLKFLFLYRKYRLQPFNYKYLEVVGVSVFTYIVGYVIPQMQWFVVDIIIRSMVVGVVFVTLIIIFRISDDLNTQVQLVWEKHIRPILRGK